MASSKANSVSPGGSSNKIRARSPEADSDGKNHGLPHPKGGPCPCPRCQGSFDTSQALAAHKKYHCRLKREGKKRRKLEVKRMKMRRLKLKTLARNAHRNLKTKINEVLEKEMKNVQGIGGAEGILRLRNNL